LFISDCVYYEEIKWDLKRICTYECRCNERLKPKVEGSTCLTWEVCECDGWVCDLEVTGVSSIFKKIRRFKRWRPKTGITRTLSLSWFYYLRIKKTRTEDKKCHDKTMMSVISDRTLK
jgi:uncharacterized protein (DUF2126 family)